MWHLTCDRQHWTVAYTTLV